MAAAHGESAMQRDPEFIQRQLPAIARYTSYFTPEVRGLDRLPSDGPALVVGNHSCLFYMPEAWICGQAVLSRRGIGAPAYLLTYDLLLALPGIGPALRRLGAIPASAGDAEQALAAARAWWCIRAATSRPAARGRSATRSTSAAGKASCGSRCAPASRSCRSWRTGVSTPSWC